VLRKARLALRADGRFALSARALLPGAPPLAPDVDGLRLVVEDAVGTPVLDLTVPGGAGWRAKAAGRFAFEAASGSVLRASVRDRGAKTPGLVRLSLRGEAGALALPAPAGLVSTVVLGPAAGACAALAWQAPEAPRPRCREKNDTISCR
jgi:hypothetical protein